MPTVPRYDGPQLQEQNLPGVQYSDAGAGNIGQAGQSIARGLGAIGDVAQDRFQKEKARLDAASVLEARRKLSDWEREEFDNPDNPNAVMNVKGREAAGLQGRVLPSFAKARAGIESSLASQEQKDAFAALSFQYEERVKDRLTRHAGAEADAYAKAEFGAALDLGMESIGTAVANNDPARVATELRAGLGTIRIQAATEGWPPEKTQIAEREFESKAHATAVQQMITLGRYDEAEEYFTANADGLLVGEEARLAPTMREIRADRIARGFVDEIETGGVSADATWGRIIHQESGGRQFDKGGAPLTSGKGAIGRAQVMPATAQETAKKHGIVWDDAKYRMDAGYNEQLGRLYFNDQIKKYGDPLLAAAAYNAGPGAVDKWLKSIGDPRKGQISHAEFASKIPFKETREYVTNVALPESGGRTYSEKLAAADRIPDQRTRAAVKARIKEQENERRISDQQAEGDAVEAIERHLAGGGSMTTLPPDVRASALEHAPKALLHYDKGGDVAKKRTDPMVYMDLIEMATEQPLKFKDLPLATKLPYLSDSDFQEIVKLQGGVRSGRGSQVAKQARLIEAVAKPILLSVGLMKQDGKSVVVRGDSRERVAKFYHELGGLVREYRAETGKDPAAGELRDMADKLLIKSTTEEPGKWFGTNTVERFAFETKKPSAGAKSAKAANLKVGQVVDGYTYIGGDVNAPDSWRKK